jgi:HSP20 family protein
MNKLVQQRSGNNGLQSERLGESSTFAPRFDVWENDDELTLCGDLPGVAPENVDIRFENQQLVIHGKVEPREPAGRFIHGEYGVGDFYRSFTIAESVDSANISAEMRDGMLTLHLPKTEDVKPRRIAVKA